MKIQSEYLQNQIPESARPVKKVRKAAPDQFEKIIKKQQKTKPDRVSLTEKPLQLDPVTNRVLSNNEKMAISRNFNQFEREIAKTYALNGKPVNMEVMLGKKIDVKG